VLARRTSQADTEAGQCYNALMLDEGTAEKELKTLYPGIEKHKYFKEHVRISVALGNGPHSKEMIKGLYALEKAMCERIARSRFWESESTRVRRLKTAFQYWKERRASYATSQEESPEKPSDLRHVLTDVLGKYELHHGFQQSGVKVPVYVDNVKTSLFVQALKERRHWKDVGAGRYHGEFTHRIQWYLLSAGGVSALLIKEPALVFATLGDYQRENPGRTLWDDLCDRRALETPNKDDWRVPDYLNEWLFTETSAARNICPVLSAFVGLRFEKRAPTTATSYVLKKLRASPENGHPPILDFDKKDKVYKPRA